MGGWGSSLMALEDIQRVDLLGKRQECPYSGTCLYLLKKTKEEANVGNAGDVVFVIQRWHMGHFFRLPIVLDVGKHLLAL